MDDWIKLPLPDWVIDYLIKTAEGGKLLNVQRNVKIPRDELTEGSEPLPGEGAQVADYLNFQRAELYCNKLKGKCDWATGVHREDTNTAAGSRPSTCGHRASKAPLLVTVQIGLIEGSGGC